MLLFDLVSPAAEGGAACCPSDGLKLECDLDVMQFGDLELISLTDGFFRVDGGAMFGVVPKLLWETRMPADEKNRIIFGLRPLVVRGRGKTIIIDAGIATR